jgi:dolichol-phosphate mannosyltransferase
MTIITVPTYNEAENIEDLVREIRREVPDGFVLVVDDNSPDGTGGIVRQMGETDDHVWLLSRTTERGRGSAGIAGFKEALARGGNLIVEMDADWSHHPRYLPALLEAATRADVVIGSRAVAGGRETGRGAARVLITKAASAFLRILLAVPVRDPTSGYRCFRRTVLESVNLDSFVSTGPSIVEEMLLRARRRGFSFIEVPIIFEDRTRGTSKLDSKLLLRTLRDILRIRFAR